MIIIQALESLGIQWVSLFGTNNQLCREQITKIKETLDPNYFGNFWKLFGAVTRQDESRGIHAWSAT